MGFFIPSVNHYWLRNYSPIPLSLFFNLLLLNKLPIITEINWILYKTRQQDSFFIVLHQITII